MKRIVLTIAAVLGLFTLAQPAFAITVSCKGFMDHVQRKLSDIKPQFVRPVMVSRSAQRFGNEVRDMITTLRIDGQVYCDGDRFVRFEARIHAPFVPSLRRGFERLQVAAASYKLRWSESRAAQTLNRMERDAAEYLRASAERGDAFVSGKIEEHAGEAGDVALVWTRTDRSFILVEYTP